MGRLRSTTLIDDVRVKVPRGGGPQPCGAEMIGFLACLDANSNDDRQCAQAREALSACLGAAARQGNSRPRHKMPINFHLQQFLRNIKR
mmetsp:Transcript_65810/g.130436  ORF Transcript_65810/g.130436 Transcript_65810/m.130436 type:complete len:89 (-) Transcript_65810:245-511(-)